jgi:phosphoribosylglycinamide formyltransferase-1
VQEHRIYPRAIQLIAEGRVRVDGRTVAIDPPAMPSATALTNPALQG